MPPIKTNFPLVYERKTDRRNPAAIYIQPHLKIKIINIKTTIEMVPILFLPILEGIKFYSEGGKL